MRRHRPTYTLLDEMLASASEPMPEATRMHVITCAYQALRAIEQETEPARNDWRVLADCVNMLETMVESGIVADTSYLLHDATRAMAEAAERHLHKGLPIRLSGPGIAAVRAVVEDYAEVIAQVSHRTMVRCHRATERRIRDIRAGKRQAHDVEVTEL